MHRLDALMALQTADAFSVRLRLRLIDPISWWQGRATDCRSCNRNRSRRAVAGSFLGEKRTRCTKQKKKTPNAERPTPNVEVKRTHHFAFFSVVRTLAAKIRINSSLSFSVSRRSASSASFSRPIKRSQRHV